MGGVVSTLTGFTGLTVVIPPSRNSTQDKEVTTTADADEDAIDQLFAPVHLGAARDPPNSEEGPSRDSSPRLRRFQICASDVSFMYGSSRRFTLYREVDGARQRLMEARYSSTGSFMTTDEYQLYYHFDGKKYLVGRVVSDGWASSKMNIEDARENDHGAVQFDHNGTLMRINCSLPKLAELDRVQLAQAVAETADILYELGDLVAEFLTPKKTWVTRKVGRPWAITDAFYSPQFAKVEDASQLCYKSYRNKTPTWNAAVNGYMLDFGGRALLPSVHNFQLTDRRAEGEEPEVVLQLAKAGTVGGPPIFNCDIAAPLSVFHAFAIAVSVLQRTNIHD